MKSVTLRRPALREELRRYLLAFLLGFGSLLVVILPIIIADGGYYICLLYTSSLNAVVVQHRMGHALIHAHSTAQNAAAHIGDSCHFHDAL